MESSGEFHQESSGEFHQESLGEFHQESPTEFLTVSTFNISSVLSQVVASEPRQASGTDTLGTLKALGLDFLIPKLDSKGTCLPVLVVPGHLTLS